MPVSSASAAQQRNLSKERASKANADDAAAAEPAVPVVAPAAALTFSLRLGCARGLFAPPAPPEPEEPATGKKKKPSTASSAAGAPPTAEPPRSGSVAGAGAKGVPSSSGGSSSTKKKRDEESLPQQLFVTFAPFEPILVAPPVVAADAPPPTAVGRKRRTDTEEVEAGPTYLNVVQSALSEPATPAAPTILKLEHTQALASREFFLDAVHASPLVLHVWTYAAGLAGGKKKDGKKKRDDDDRPFGDLDADCVAKMAEVHVDLHDLLRGETTIEGWFPMIGSDPVSPTAPNTARVAAGTTARGAPSATTTRNTAPAATVASAPSPAGAELFVSIQVDRVLVDAAEADASNVFTLTLERVERMPNWILDCTQMEAIEAIKRQIEEADLAAAAAAAGGSRPGTAGGPTVRTDAPVNGLPLGRVSSPGGQASRTTGSRRGKGTDPLDEFPPADHADAFALAYNMPLHPDPTRQRTVRPSPPVPVVGWNEVQREATRVGLVNDGGGWIPPRREVPQVEEPPSAKKKGSSGSGAGAANIADTPGSKKKPSITAPGGATSGRSSGRTTPFLEVPAGTAAAAEPVVLYQDPLVWNPSTPRASLLLNHSQACFMGAAAVTALRDGIRSGKPFLLQLEHTRTLVDEKAAAALPDGGRTHQRAVVLADLRPLLKPGATSMSACFAVRQTSTPLPPPRPADEGKKKRAGGAGGASGSPNKRASLAHAGALAELLDGGAPAPILPPETFDEARSFLVLRVELAKPLVPRRAQLSVQDVLPAPTGILQPQPPLASSFFSAAAGAAVDQPAALLAAPRTIGSAPAPVASIASQNKKPEQELEDFRVTVRELVTRMLGEYEAGGFAALASSEEASSSHAIPSSVPASSSTSAFQQLLDSSSLTLHFVAALQPKLRALIEARFHAPLSGPHAAQQPAHSLNELYAELSEEALTILREHLASRSGSTSTPAAVDKAAAELRATFVKRGQLACFAEQHGDLALAHLHHLGRLSDLVAHLGSPAQVQLGFGGLGPVDLVRAWYELGCFLLRRQNGAVDLAAEPMSSDETNAAVERPRKSGTIDGVNAAVDLAEECMRQCLRYDPYFAPALACLAFLYLEQNEVEASLEFVVRGLHVAPNHALLLSIQGLYHELAEEDAEAASAYYRATECMRDFLDAQGSHAPNTADGLLYSLLGEHGRGTYSLPLLHSQSVHLMLARTLGSLGFRRLASRVLYAQVAALDAKMATQTEAEAAASHGDYPSWGPYLELAAWYAEHPGRYRSHAVPLLEQVSRLIGAQSVDAHHAHSLLYAFATQGDVHFANGAHRRAAEYYGSYLKCMQSMKLNLYLDPLVVCNASSVALLRESLPGSLQLATLLCTHPVHTRDPYLWVLLGRVLAALGESARAEEASAEAATKDSLCARAWAAVAINQLRRVQSEHAAATRRAVGVATAATPVDPNELTEARHAFALATRGPAPLTDAKVLQELARLWWQHGCGLEAELALTRALGCSEPASAAGVATKLAWLRSEQAGFASEETAAAIVLQRHSKGFLERKRANMKRRKGLLANMVIQATK